MLDKKRLFGLVLIASFVVSLTALAVDLPPGGSFTDDDGNVHEGYIEAIAAEGITRGCNPPENTEYCPGDPVTRGQMAAFIHRALPDLPLGGATDFVDDDDSVFEADVEWLSAAGVTKGCNPPTNDRFCPDAHVTRGQMAAFLVRALGYTDDGGGDLFTDDDDSVFEADIDRLGTAGVTRGCNPPTNDRFCPDDLVLRDQMASFLGRALGLTPITPPPPATTTTTTTSSTSTSTTTTTTPPAGFGDGTWLVGSEIPAGTYRNSDSSNFCYAERLSGLGGTLDEIIANEFADYILIVTIEPTDVAFSSDDCGTWSSDLSPRKAPGASFGDGMWLVGSEVQPGIWRNSDSSEFCYWERLSGFSWLLDDIIANEFSDTIQTVEIQSGDVGFTSSDCGTWTRIG